MGYCFGHANHRPDPARSTATRIFASDSARPPADAAWIAHLLVRANLRGHDSHGVIRIPQYAGP